MNSQKLMRNATSMNENGARNVNVPGKEAKGDCDPELEEEGCVPNRE